MENTRRKAWSFPVLNYFQILFNSCLLRWPVEILFGQNAFRAKLHQGSLVGQKVNAHQSWAPWKHFYHVVDLTMKPIIAQSDVLWSLNDLVKNSSVALKIGVAITNYVVAISELKPRFFSHFGPKLKWIFQLTPANFEANSAKILVQTPSFGKFKHIFWLTWLSHKYLPIESRSDLCLLRLSNGIQEDCGVQSFVYFMTVLDGAEHLSFSHHTVQTKTPPWAKCQAAFLLREPPPPSGVLRMCRVKMCLDPEASLHCLSLHIS